MKEYNLYMIDIVKELIAKGRPVTWSFTAGGMAEMRIRAQAGGRHFDQAWSHAHRFWQMLSDAYIFVGMGTALSRPRCSKSRFLRPADRTGLTYGSSRMLPTGQQQTLSAR